MKQRRLQMWIAFVILVSPIAAVAGDLSGYFKLGVRLEEIAEAGSVSYSVLNTRNNEYIFLPPSGWKSDVDVKARTISWTSPDYQSLIRLQVPESESEETPSIKSEALRQEFLRDFSDARILEESPSYSAGLAGLAFDADRTVDGKFQAKVRAAFLPVAGGMLKVTLSTPKEQFVSRQGDLSRFMNSLRTTKNNNHEVAAPRPAPRP